MPEDAKSLHSFSKTLEEVSHLFLQTLAALARSLQGKIQCKQIEVTKPCYWNTLTHATQSPEHSMFTE